MQKKVEITEEAVKMARIAQPEEFKEVINEKVGFLLSR